MSFKIKYVNTDLLVAPKGTSNSLGTLKKGAVVLITDDADPYYYKVRLDNGLEGYIYKDAGKTAPGLTLTKIIAVNGTEPKEAAPKAIAPKAGPVVSTNGAAPEVAAPTVRKSVKAPRPRPETSAPVPSTARVIGAGPSITISSAEIAVSDKPGITGRQVAKLRRGERVTLLSDDGFFFQVKLATGIVGYIPRYAGEQS
jgi:uncharacterized protein YgiM (DUF1202 family)